MPEYRAYAKLNLTLDILGRLPNGYHRMDMLMQSVSLWDSLHVCEAPELRLTVENGEGLDGPDNLVLKAARLLREKTGARRGAQLRLVKRIPVEAGMGGGSADAAAALRALNGLWGLGLDKERLCALGAELGADVPFCILGGTARATGTGTELEALPRKLPLHFAVCKPCGGLSTGRVYRMYDESGETNGEACTPEAVRALISGDRAALACSLGNALEGPALALRPEIGEALETLRGLGALSARMTGSGSAVFGLFEGNAEAEKGASALRTRYGSGWAVEAVDKGVERV